jgi:hypothetical protein
MAESAARTGPPGGAEKKAPAVGSEEGVSPEGRGPPPCRYGDGCARADCWFSHPKERTPEPSPAEQPAWCPHGPACAVPGCLRHHDRSRSPARARAACRWGGQCLSPVCPFRHPAGWDPEAATEAAFERNRRLERGKPAK